MKLHSIEQYTEDWKRLRMGIPTASNFHLLMTPGGKPTSPDNKMRRQYLYRLVAERILQTPMPDSFAGNQYTEDGHEREEYAAEIFKQTVKRELLDGGFMTTEDASIGCSPDRLMVRNGIWECVEIKAPAPWTHIQFMVEGPGDKYKPQVQGQFLIGNFKAVHFWSYHPDFAPVHIVSEPDKQYIAILAVQLELFCAELESVEAFVRRQGNYRELIEGMANENTGG